jgi:hypothetical protein
MNFLDPAEWADLEALEKEYVELDEKSIKILHERLRPYFLRRIKSEVLQLPAKVCALSLIRVSFLNPQSPQSCVRTKSLSLFL